MASPEPNLWQETLERVQGGAGGAALPPWLWQADLVEKAAPAPGRAAPPHLEVRLPKAVHPDELSAALRSAVARALQRTLGRQVELEFVSRPAPAAPEAAAGPARPPSPPASRRGRPGSPPRTACA